MKIMVPIKRVVDPYAKVKALPDGTGLDTGGAKFEINPFDEIALEEAVRKREADPSVQIVAVSIGSSTCEDQLRKALAMGADEAILIESDAEWDSPSVAAELAALAKELAPDLVLMGKQATDDDNNQAAQMLAALLDWPQATFASKLDLAGGRATVARETDTGEEVLEMALPCVVTTDLRLNEPRYIALPGIIKARSKPLAKRRPTTEPRLRTRTVRLDAPPTRPPGRKVGSVDELVSELKARGVVA